MRLIDADALIADRLEFEAQHYTVRDDFDKGRLAGWNDVIRTVRKYVPTIDAVPVVRCMECIYRVKLTGECTNNGGVWGNDGYCSDGKRREDGDA